VIGDIDVVVVMNEIIPLNTPENREDKNGKENENDEFGIELRFDGVVSLLRTSISF